MIFLKRWASVTWKSIWSKTAALIFLVGFVVAEIIWVKLFGLNKALEQAFENLIPAVTGVVVTALVIAVKQLFSVWALITKENNELYLIMKSQSDEAKRIAKWLRWHLDNLNIGISKAYLFGSITHNYYKSEDVDVVLKFRDMKDKEYVKNEHKLQPLVIEFNKTFGKQLHFQRFLASESDSFNKFISKQSEPLLIIQRE